MAPLWGLGVGVAIPAIALLAIDGDHDFGAGEVAAALGVYAAGLSP